MTEAAAEFRMDDRPADLLLAASASLGLLEKAGASYRNSELAEQFLVEGRPYYFGAQIRYSDLRTYLPWHRVGEALRSNRPLTWDPQQQSMFDTTNPKMVAEFWDAMFSTSRFTARALAEAYDFGAHRRLLDVGGGAGAFPIELCQRLPQLQATILDLPHVCARAEERSTWAGSATPVSLTPGSWPTTQPARTARWWPAGPDITTEPNDLEIAEHPVRSSRLDRGFSLFTSGGGGI